MLLGKILAEAGMREGKFVSWLPSYGAEVRGGTAYCMVIISDEEIGSPYIEQADTLIMMNAPSWERFRKRIKKGGLCLLNSSLVTAGRDKKALLFQHPFTEIAAELGDIRVANTVALGYFLKAKKLLQRKTVLGVISAIAPGNKKGLIAPNIQALEKGVNLP